MLKKITFPLLLSIFILISLSSTACAQPGMVTYENPEFGFLIQYPEGWVAEEDSVDTIVVFNGPMRNEYPVNAEIWIEEMGMLMSPEEYIRDDIQWLPEEYEVIGKFTGTADGEPYAGYVTVNPMFDDQFMQIYFVRDLTAYSLYFYAAPGAFDGANDEFFTPMVQSFRFIEKEPGIVIQNFMVTPSQVKPGDEVRVKFEVFNEGDVEKTRTFHLYDDFYDGGTFDEIDFRSVTLGPNERQVIEFNLVLKDQGWHYISVEDQGWDVEVFKEAGEWNGRESETSDRPPEKGKEDINWEQMGVILLVVGVVGGWVITQRKNRLVKKLLNDIDNVYSTFKMKSRRCEAELYRLKDVALDEFKAGRINETTFQILDGRIDNYLKEIREQIVNEKFGGVPATLKKELHRMLEDGEVSEDDYETLEKLLMRSTGVTEEEKSQLRETFGRWKSDED